MISTHFPPYHLGGDAKMVYYLSRELVNRGHEVTVICDPSVHRMLRRGSSSKKQPPSDQMGISVFSPNDMDVKTHPLVSLMFNLSGSARRVLDSQIRAVKPDVIHWHNTKGFLGTPIAHHKAAAVLYTAHDYYLVCLRSNLVKPDMTHCGNPNLCIMCTLRWKKPPQIWRIGGRRVISPSSDFIVLSPSNYMARRLESDGLVVDGILRNFVPDSAKSTEHKSEERKRPVLLYVGMLEPHKGVSTLLRAFKLSCERQGFELVIVGDGTERNRIQKMVHDLGLLSRIKVPGFVDDEELVELRSLAAFQVVPSEWPENAPLTILESYCHGVPVIGSDQGGIPEIVTEESGSLMFRARDIVSLSESIVRAWNCVGRISAHKRQARAAYEQIYSPESHLQKYLNVIRA